jgi:hypothetical protein
VGSAVKFQRGVIREHAVFCCAGCDKEGVRLELRWLGAEWNHRIESLTDAQNPASLLVVGKQGLSRPSIRGPVFREKLRHHLGRENRVLGKELLKRSL